MRMFNDLYGDDIPEKIGLFVFGTMAVVFNRVEALDELFVTKNSAYSKHQLERTLSLPMLRNAMVSMETEDPLYKLKRKALSAAFLKSKMDLIAHNIKETALMEFEMLQARGDVNEVDLNLYTQQVQSSIIVSIIIGPGLAFDKLSHIDINTGAAEIITVSCYMNNLAEDVMQRMTQSPFAAISPESEWLAIDKRFAENCRTLRSYFGKIIDERKKNKDLAKG